MSRYPHLLSPLKLGPIELKNRIIFGPHENGHEANFDAWLAYLKARAEGGAALVITGFTSTHASSGYPTHQHLQDDSNLEAYSQLADAIHAHGAKLFIQLGHIGRHRPPLRDDGARRAVWGVSASNPDFPAYNVRCREMDVSLIGEVVASFASAARRATSVGVDGVEISLAQDSLLSAFLSERLNRRTDEYGGSLANRFRIVRDILTTVRAAMGTGKGLGVRLNMDDCDGVGYAPEDAVQVAEAIEKERLSDYLHPAIGGMGTRRGLFNVCQSMTTVDGAGAHYARLLKDRLSLPIIANGRINDPTRAESIIANGDADAVSMVRPLICDPDYGTKLAEDRKEDIRACIACNQACIGHLLAGYPVSCIQNPAAGREQLYRHAGKTKVPRRVLIAGGGPGGMKAAVEAAARGHQVTLCEASGQLGGQILLAQLLPGRAEFGGASTNLKQEVTQLGIEVRLNTRVSRAFVAELAPDAVIVATGARPIIPTIEGDHPGAIVSSWDVLTGRASVGNRVIVSDVIGDWIAPAIAERLVLEGRQVTLLTLQSRPGEAIGILGDEFPGRLHELGVEVIPFARLFGLDGATAYLENALSLRPIVRDGIETVVVCHGTESVDDLTSELKGAVSDLKVIGDSLTPRTAEEAILEGLEAAAAL